MTKITTFNDRHAKVFVAVILNHIQPSVLSDGLEAAPDLHGKL